MPALRNPRHERFAQELAKGKTTIAAAHVAAGYRRNKGSAYRLRHHPAIEVRVAELLGTDVGAVGSELARFSDLRNADVRTAAENELRQLFRPNEGPQTAALLSRADILGY